MPNSEYMKLIEEVSGAGRKYYALEDVSFDAEVEKTLVGLGFERKILHDLPVSLGGWRMRIELAKILLKDPDHPASMSLPTTSTSSRWCGWKTFDQQGQSGYGNFHDKAFIDNITTRTVELTMGKIYDYKANYTHYLQLREERRTHQLKAYREQQKMTADTANSLSKDLGYLFQDQPGQLVERMLEKLEIIEVDEVDNSALKLRFPFCAIRGLSGDGRWSIQIVRRPRGL